MRTQLLLALALSASFATAAVKSQTTLAPLNESIEVLLSGTPSNILAAHSAYAPHSATLTLRGRYLDFPAVEFAATATLDTNSASGWQVSPVSVSGALPAGVSAPVIQAELVTDGFGQLPTAYVWVKGDEGVVRSSTWNVAGSASDQVGVVLLPRFRMLPWRGAKQVDVVKVRYTAPSATQTPPQVYANLKSQLETSYAKMSNGRLSFSVSLQDHLTSLVTPNLVNASCADFFAAFPNTGLSFQNRLISEIRASDPTRRRDAIYLTYDPGFSGGLTCEYFRTPHGGAQPPSAQCPNCGPGGEIKASSVFPGEWGYSLTSIFGHELGHAIGQREKYFNPINFCTDGGPDTVKPGHLFFKGNNCQQNYGGLMDESMGAYGVRESVRYDVIDRASLGWLKPANVAIASRPGIYDLYQENDDLTVPENLPVILQVPVQYAGIQDYVYLTTINRNVFERVVAGPYPAMTDHQSNGVIMSAGADLTGATMPLVTRQGAGKHAAGLNYYSYRNNNSGTGTQFNAIPVGASVRLTEFGAPVAIRVLSKNNGRVRVQVGDVPAPTSFAVGGQVQTPGGQGLRSAVVKLTIPDQPAQTVTTSSFGYYSFPSVPAGVTVTITVTSRRYRFRPVVQEFTADTDDLNFVGLE